MAKTNLLQKICNDITPSDNKVPNKQINSIPPAVFIPKESESHNSVIFFLNFAGSWRSDPKIDKWLKNLQ